MLKEKRCPRCDYLVEDPGTVRCPRCHKSLLVPACCSGNCRKCGEHQGEREKCLEVQAKN